ncbi:MAG: riboflavin biosynthesis protein RibF [Bacteroidales bacterium]|nr:riboflavin biosynthesis protein RibF [Bacteroidales bacterium]MBD5223103.1 riboflavin biosynthesis protein RibF [Bacteroidales bacterium]
MESRKRIATIGMFDGLHRGHQAVLGILCDEAASRRLDPLVFTFDRHPLETIDPARAPKTLMDPDLRDDLIRSRGIRVERVQFSDKIRNLTAAQWLRRMASVYGVEVLILGYDNTFGSDGRNLNIDDYRHLAAEAGIELLTTSAVPGCSSSAVRRALSDGDTVKAAEILGSPFTVSGPVVHGRQMGRTIGFPTANININPRRQLPLRGVYAARVVNADDNVYNAVVNIGNAPTLSDGSTLTVEAHLLDFSGDLYGRTLQIEFGPRIREERHFASADDLKNRINLDIARARKLLKKN